MTPASDIIKRCGGNLRVAEWLGLERTAVQRWTYPKDKGGTGERIPTRHWAALIAKAAEHGSVVRLEELIPPDAAAASRIRPAAEAKHPRAAA